MNAKQTIKGFTIIEVVLVLAIAGLIFLMVFIALPALQSGQRDTARKNDVSIVASAVNTYASANKGNLPNSAQLQGYVANVSGNTTVTNVTVQARGATTTVAVTDTQVKVVTGAKCGATGAATVANGVKTATQTIAAGTARQYATITLLEGGNGTSFCQDS